METFEDQSIALAQQFNTLWQPIVLLCGFGMVLPCVCVGFLQDLNATVQHLLLVHSLITSFLFVLFLHNQTIYFLFYFMYESISRLFFPDKVLPFLVW